VALSVVARYVIGVLAERYGRAVVYGYGGWDNAYLVVVGNGPIGRRNDVHGGVAIVNFDFIDGVWVGFDTVTVDAPRGHGVATEWVEMDLSSNEVVVELLERAVVHARESRGRKDLRDAGRLHEVLLAGSAVP
jgi:hypothetical protein